MAVPGRGASEQFRGVFLQEQYGLHELCLISVLQDTYSICMRNISDVSDDFFTERMSLTAHTQKGSPF